jgi:DNA-binding MarR family transcriptional regulator
MGLLDTVDVVRSQWKREFPDLDTRPLAVTHRITALATRLNRDAEAVLGGLAVSGPTFDVLAALYATGPPYRLSPTQLYKGRLVSSGGMTARIDLAEAAGLVARSRTQNDRRGVTVTLTEAGVRVVRKGVAALLAKERHLGVALDPDERANVTALLMKLLQTPKEHPPRTAASAGSSESLISSWVRAFPNHDSWLVHFLGAIPLLSSQVDRESRKILGPLGVTPNAFGLLCALRRAGAPFRLTPSELYDVVVLSPAGVAGLLEKLEGAGLIERSADPRDKRLNRASLTKKGQKVVRTTIGDFVMCHDRLLKSLSESQRERLSKYLRQVLSTAESIRSD